MFIDSDRHFMKRALDQAILAMDKNEVPIGSVITHKDSIIGKGYNQVEQTKDATAHAEIIAIGSASQSVNNWRLKGCTLYVTLEPCPMCVGAIINSRVAKIVFGAKDTRLGACGSVCNLAKSQYLSHSIEIVEGIMQEDCKDLLQVFFLKLRNQKSKLLKLH